MLQRVAKACEASRRDPSSVTLVAASKNQPVAALLEMFDLGQKEFGENRLQEALPKIAALPTDVTWHFIGRLQSNKARKAADAFDVIQTLESKAQLREIDKSCKVVDGLIEVNIADEFQKNGLSVDYVDEFLQEVLNSTHVHFRGLMTVGPALDDPEKMRMYFRRLRELGERLGSQWLSMGMSGDFDVAIQEGATHVRVGTALFGPRPQ